MSDESQPDVETTGEEDEVDYTDPTTTEVPDARMDFWIAIVLIVASGILFVSTGEFAGIRTSEYDPGAAFWPRAILVVMAVAGIVNAFNIYKRAKEDGEVSDLFVMPSFNVGGWFADSGNVRFVLVILLSIGYLLLIYPVGFLFATPPFLMAMAWTLGFRNRPISLLAFGVVIGFTFHVLFAAILNIAMPTGTGWFQEMTYRVENLV